MNRKIMLVIGIVVILACAIGVFGIIQNKKLETIRSMTIAQVDLTTISDGKYQGSFEYSKTRVEVEVTVKNHRIEDIQVLENRDTKHTQMAAGVIEHVLGDQSLQVDVVAGATTTSKAFLKAIENALLQKKE